ncbi:hypothetical protein ACFWFF_13115 [Streptomyces sp. NPDC060223]|uniref:hypothetical protein n=1 Tax=unclassified Streptomyces TaxID=2593676 RepID=UPI0036400137
MTDRPNAVPGPAPQPLPPARLQQLVDELRDADRRNRAAVNLIPSETRLSPLAALPLATDFYNRYFFDEHSGFRGGLAAHRLESEVAAGSLARLSGARHVNTRPVSGMSAMTLAIAALAGPRGNTVISVGDEHGGHYATREVVEYLGYRSATVAFRSGRVDRDDLVRALHEGTPGLVYLDLQHSLHLPDVAAVVETVRRHGRGVPVHVDCSHTLGLVLGGAVPHPLEAGADSMGGSTHKTFPGPHKGVLITDRPDVAERFHEADMRLISSHHFAESLSLGLAAAEFEHFGAGYAAATLANAELLAESLHEEGFEVAKAGETFTRTHQVWVRIGDPEDTQRFFDRVTAVGLRVNRLSRLPGWDGPMIRLGTNEVTFEGAGPRSIRLIAAALGHARRAAPGRGPDAPEIRASFGRPHFFDDPAHLDPDAAFNPVTAFAAAGRG